MQGGSEGLSIFVFIGGLSAATSMVAIACMALSGMVGNELVLPLLLRRNREMTGNIGRLALLVRRLSVIAILLAAYAYHRTIAGYLPLATIGMVSFCAVANFAPALLLGLYWRRTHRYGVIAGLAGGFFVWFASVLWPTVERGTALLPLPAIGPLAWFDALPRGFVVGVLVNLALLVVVSLLARPQSRDQRQAAAFVADAEPDALIPEPREQGRDLAQLQELAARFIGEGRAAEAFAGLTLSGNAAYEFVERLLSGTIGAASARVVMGTARRRALWMPGSVREVLHDATAAIRYNADLLRKTLDHVGLGIAVFDAEGKLEIWNERFAVLIGAPAEILVTGVKASQIADRAPILADITAWNAAPMRELRLADGRSTDLRIDPLTGGGIVVTASDVTDRVRAAEALRDSERRIRIVTDNVPVLIAYVDRDQRYRFTNRAYQATMRTTPSQTDGRHVADILGPARYRRLLPHIEGVLAGIPQTFEIDFPTNDARIEVASGTYLPHFDTEGAVVGFFLLYVDISERRRAEEALRVVNESLERRVAQRTAELESARARAEEANVDKTRFIAAASHDLLQPLHAARLFAAALAERHPRDELVEKIDHGLAAVESLLDALLDIAKLDAGAVKPEVRAVPVGPLLDIADRLVRADRGKAGRGTALRPHHRRDQKRSRAAAARAAELPVQRHPLQRPARAQGARIAGLPTGRGIAHRRCGQRPRYCPRSAAGGVPGVHPPAPGRARRRARPWPRLGDRRPHRAGAGPPHRIGIRAGQRRRFLHRRSAGTGLGSARAGGRHSSTACPPLCPRAAGGVHRRRTAGTRRHERPAQFLGLRDRAG